jgi:hypothetical protein
MDYSLVLILLAICIAFCISVYRKKQEDAFRRKDTLINALNTQVAQIVEQDSDEERKKRILEKIKKVGIFQCEQQNLHLR